MGHLGLIGHSGDMTSCHCTRVRPMTIVFSGGLDLHRCPGCERNTWRLDGREVSLNEARSELHGRFTRLRSASARVAGRGHRPATKASADLAARRQARVHAAVELAQAEARQVEISAALALGVSGVGALLAAQGMPGTWSVLGAASA